jgi:hypothetical protein
VTHEPVFEIGERVRKNHGYLWPGVVVAVFETLGGERRVVVECTAPDVAGALHIFNPNQLERV